ncbi:hypothetical protein EON64_17100 [archaeon]|nr:MAG: hypothetical protein EON64_17100 [archaeon]
MRSESKQDDKDASYSASCKLEEKNDELNVIAVCGGHDDITQPQVTSPLLRGMSLNLTLAAEAKARLNDPVAVQEEFINVVFDLPDGSQGEGNFKLGQSVEVLKSFVESEYGIPMATQRMFLNSSEKQMLNPLSLLDYAEVKGG